MYLKRGDDAVSEVIGAVMLLAIAVVFISTLYATVLSDPGPYSVPAVKIVGTVENGDVLIDHRSGEPLSLDTRIMLTIAGFRQVFTTVDEMLDEEAKLDGFWNIGERLIYSDFNLSDFNVYITAVDEESDSIIMWGLLQEGDIIYAPGGIWHFNENSGNTAVDILNNNNGTLHPDEIFGPQWDEEVMAAGTSSLRFDGLDDYVIVNGNSISLDITDAITIESWIKFPEDSVLHNYTFGPAFGYEPNVIHVANNVYAIAYRDQKEAGILKTVKLYHDGTITQDISNNSLEFGDKCYWPKITHVSDDVYMIAYAQSRNNPQYAYLKTVKMLDNGTTIAVLDDYDFSPKEVYDYELMKIADNLSVLAYRDGNEHGVLRTIKTSDNGTSINASLTNGTFEFDSINCFEPDLICVADNIYAITYRGNNDNGYLKTVRIADNGTIYPQVIDTFIFDLLNETYESQIIHVANSTYAIAYRDYNKNGLLATVEINENGTIIKQVIDILEFEDNYCLLPDITHMRNEIYLIAYEYEQLDGYVASVKIKPNGSISFESKFQFNTKKNYHGLEPDIIRLSDDIYAIAFRSGSLSGTPHEGHLICCRFSYYDLPVDPLGIRVINREGVYGIYVNQTHISATIGNHVISKEMVLSTTDWNQIVLTYNNSIMKLYINGNEETSEFYNGGIASSTRDIYFGRSFYGHIDEIAIYGRELLPDEILYHYNNPGKLESSIP